MEHISSIHLKQKCSKHKIKKMERLLIVREQLVYQLLSVFFKTLLKINYETIFFYLFYPFLMLEVFTYILIVFTSTYVWYSKITRIREYDSKDRKLRTSIGAVVWIFVRLGVVHKSRSIWLHVSFSFNT